MLQTSQFPALQARWCLSREPAHSAWGGGTTSRARGRQCGLHPRMGNTAALPIQTLHPQAPTLWSEGPKELTG